jgi:hypothetical protein
MPVIVASPRKVLFVWRQNRPEVRALVSDSADDLLIGIVL